MKAIFASKLYKASSHKDKIKAALKDPINKELVQQLSEYLDEPEMANGAPDDVEVNGKHGKVDAPSPKDRTISRGGPSGGSAAMKADHLADLEQRLSGGEPEGDSEEFNPEDQEGGQVEDIPEEEVPVEEVPVEEEANEPEKAETTSSTKIKKSVFAGKHIEREVLSQAVEEIKGTLNARADTAGVNRAMVKENELWIYYNDDINLNNVMGPVIELLNAANYYYLEFNRLARSDNAIVLQVSFMDTESKMDPIEEAEDDKD